MKRIQRSYIEMIGKHGYRAVTETWFRTTDAHPPYLAASVLRYVSFDDIVWC